MSETNVTPTHEKHIPGPEVWGQSNPLGRRIHAKTYELRKTCLCAVTVTSISPTGGKRGQFLGEHLKEVYESLLERELSDIDEMLQRLELVESCAHIAGARDEHQQSKRS